MKLKYFLQDEMPLGKGAIKLPIKATIDKYRNEYDIITKEQHKRFKVEFFKTPGERIIAHLKVPSQSLNNFYYDVIIEFITTPSTSSYEDCDIRIFSNSPSFVYYYAYVFYHLAFKETDNSKSNTGMMIDLFKDKIPRDRLLLPGTEHKLGEDPLLGEPITRNPYGIPLFDKSIYLAIFYLMDKVNFNIIQKINRHKTLNQIISNVPHFDKLMLERKNEAEKERNSKKSNDKKLQKTITKVETNVQKMNRPTNIKKPLKPKSPMRAKTGYKSTSKPITKK